MNKLKLIKAILERFNLWDFLLKLIMETPRDELIKQMASLSKTEPKEFIKKFMNNPELIGKDLANATPLQLAQLSEAIAKARYESGFRDKTTGAESQALSSSWLIFGLYTPITSKTGTIRITTIQGKDYFFPKPMKLSTWDRMRKAQGRNGTGAGQIFHDEYWSKLRGKQQTPGTATIFKLLEFKKQRAKKVLKLTKTEAKIKKWNKTMKKWK